MDMVPTKEDLNKLFEVIIKANDDDKLAQELLVNPRVVLTREGVETQVIDTFIAGDEASVEKMLVDAGYKVNPPRIIKW